MRKLIVSAGLCLATLISLGSPATAGQEISSPEQVRCVVAMNKAFTRMVKATNKATSVCAGGPATSFDGCLAAANTAAIESKTASTMQKKCLTPEVSAASTVGYTGDASLVNGAARGQMSNLARELLANSSDSSEADRCQQAVVKGTGKLASVLAKETVRRKKAALKGKLGAPPETASQLADALMAARLSPKVTGAAAKLAAKIQKKCVGLDLAEVSSDACPSAASVGELAECGSRTAQCRFCLALNEADELSIDCATYSGLSSCPAESGVCGDGMLSGSEECDDGNTAGGDECSATCMIEELHVCGDGAATGTEECDDGNTMSADGCDAECMNEFEAPNCGDGVLDSGEQCDDGNIISEDGCSSQCLIEGVDPFCGDGILDDGEECDDGNTVGGDACDADCTVPNAIAPPDGNFNDPLDIPLDGVDTSTDFVSFPNGDTTDRVRFDVIGMNQVPGLPGGQAQLVITTTCFGEGQEHIEFTSAGNTVGCNETVVDQLVTANSDTGTVTIEAAGGVGTHVEWFLTGTATRIVNEPIAPPDANFNDPLDIPLDGADISTDIVSFPNGDTTDRVRFDVTGMNQTPGLPGGQAQLLIHATCFGQGQQHIRFSTGGLTFGCNETVVDQLVTANSDTGTVVIEAVGGLGTAVGWTLTGTAPRVN